MGVASIKFGNDVDLLITLRLMQSQVFASETQDCLAIFTRSKMHNNCSDADKSVASRLLNPTMEKV